MNAWADLATGLTIAAIAWTIIWVAVWVAVLVAPKDQQ